MIRKIIPSFREDAVTAERISACNQTIAVIKGLGPHARTYKVPITYIGSKLKRIRSGDIIDVKKKTGSRVKYYGPRKDVSGMRLPMSNDISLPSRLGGEFELVNIYKENKV